VFVVGLAVAAASYLNTVARGNKYTTGVQVDLGTFKESNKKSTDRCSTDLPVQIPDESPDVLIIPQRMAALLLMMLQSLSKTHSLLANEILVIFEA
jgi:hypothetical protein